MKKREKKKKTNRQKDGDEKPSGEISGIGMST